MGVLVRTLILLVGRRSMVAAYLFVDTVLMKAAIGHAGKTSSVKKVLPIYAIFLGKVFHRFNVFRPSLINSGRGVHYEASSFSSHINDLFAIFSYFLGRTRGQQGIGHVS